MIVTGASRGIGRAVAEAVAAEGGRLVVPRRGARTWRACWPGCASAAPRRTAWRSTSPTPSPCARRRRGRRGPGAGGRPGEQREPARRPPAAGRLPDGRLGARDGGQRPGTLRSPRRCLPAMSRGAAIVNVTSGAAGARPGGLRRLQARLDGVTRILRDELADREIRCVGINLGRHPHRMRAAAYPDGRRHRAAPSSRVGRSSPSWPGGPSAPTSSRAVDRRSTAIPALRAIGAGARSHRAGRRASGAGGRHRATCARRPAVPPAGLPGAQRAGWVREAVAGALARAARALPDGLTLVVWDGYRSSRPRPPSTTATSPSWRWCTPTSRPRARGGRGPLRHAALARPGAPRRTLDRGAVDLTLGDGDGRPLDLGPTSTSSSSRRARGRSRASTSRRAACGACCSGPWRRRASRLRRGVVALDLGDQFWGLVRGHPARYAGADGPV